MLGLEIMSMVLPARSVAEAVGLAVDDCRECVGGVGGRPGAPILRDVCFSVGGLDLCKVVPGEMFVSMFERRDF